RPSGSSAPTRAAASTSGCWNSYSSSSTRRKKRNLPKSLIEIVDKVGWILESDRQPHHPLRAARLLQFVIRQAKLRRQDRQAAKAFHAAKAGRPLDDV